MGFDKPDLGFVVHYQAPGSAVAYYQQVGRAGRAIGRSVDVMLFGTEDDEIHEHFRTTAFPSQEEVDLILKALAESDDLSVYELEGAVNLRSKSISHVLSFLAVESPSPVIKDGSKWKRTPVTYHLDHERIERLTHQREEEWQQLQGYLDERECLMRYLARALDDSQTDRCGRCEPCLGAPVVDPTFSQELVREAARFLRHAEFDLDCRVRIPAGALTQHALGPGNLPAELRAEKGRVLSRWRDDSWGQLVSDGKAGGRFSDELVDVAVDMLNERWQPDPRPEWVTCVPSTSHPSLVPEYAERLAAALQLPFEPVVSKARQTQPQKLQDNSFHQCRNLDGAFAIDDEVPPGPVLLVDDVVDSRWTLTLVAALLLQRGSGPVWPLALAASWAGG